MPRSTPHAPKHALSGRRRSEVGLGSGDYPRGGAWHELESVRPAGLGVEADGHEPVHAHHATWHGCLCGAAEHLSDQLAGTDNSVGRFQLRRRARLAVVCDM